MRIALIAPLVTPIAPPFPGGAQALLRDLAITLAQRGHEVTLFAARGSQVEHVIMRDLNIEPAPAQLVRLSGHQVSPLDASFYRQAEGFLRIFLTLRYERHCYDIVHAHAFDWPAYAFGALAELPVLHTLHLPAISPPIGMLLRTISSVVPPSPSGRESLMARAQPVDKSTLRPLSTWLVTVSRACAATWAPYTPVDAVIYNGIRVEDIPFQPTPGDFLLFAGRISPEKGVDRAIAIAQRARLPLHIAGDIYDHAYYRECVQPLLARAGDSVRYLGHLDHTELYRLMGSARALLCPVLWEEPFGLVAVEAMAAGTPVIAFARGAMPEVIQQEVTGFLVAPDDINAAAAAVAHVGMLDRSACRHHVTEFFSLERMVTEYEAFYARML
jgi:UDP-glucose:tetrahydrobiopterin glucosyltransferase